MPYEVKVELCDKCGDCIEACPKNAITFTQEGDWRGPIRIDNRLCNECNDCKDACPNEAIWRWSRR